MPNKKILLVEDDPFLVDIYVKKLQQVGFDIVNADNGARALKLLAESPFDLVLLDIVMPDIDGWEILKEMRESEKGPGAKVIVFSNLGQKADVDKAFTLGANKYLIKANYTPSEVIEEVKKIFE